MAMPAALERIADRLFGPRVDAPGGDAWAGLLAPDSYQEKDDWARRDGLCERVVVVTHLPENIVSGQLDAILFGFPDAEVSLHITPVDRKDALEDLDAAETEAEFRAIRDQAAHRLPDKENQDALEQIDLLQRRLLRQRDEVLDISLSILVRAGSVEDLDAVTEEVEKRIGRAGAQSRRASWEGPRALAAALPLGHDALGCVSRVDGTTVRAINPLARRLVCDTGPRAVEYGFDRDMLSPVVVDNFDPRFKVFHAVIIAGSGGGKTWAAASIEVARAVAAGVEVHVIDPKGDYPDLTRKLGGTIVTVAPGSDQHINPLALPGATRRDAGDLLAGHVSDLISFLEIILLRPGEALDGDADALLKGALLACYAGKGIHPGDPSAHRREAPVLADLRAALRTAGAGGLAGRLDPYVDGIFRGLFDQPTNVDPEGRLTDYRLNGIKDDAMRAAAMHLIMQQISARAHAGPVRPRSVVADEIETILRLPPGDRYVDDFSRRYRSEFLALVGLSQDPLDFLKHEGGRQLLINSGRKILLGQDHAVARELAGPVHLSEDEIAYLTTWCKEPGQALLRMDRRDSPPGGNRIKVQIRPYANLDRLLVTNPHEAQAAARAAAAFATGGARP